MSRHIDAIISSPPDMKKMPISSEICLFRKHTVEERKRRDTRIYMNLLNLGVNLPTENREHILMNSEGLNIYLQRGKKSPSFDHPDLLQA